MNALAHSLMLTIEQISQITGVRKSTLRYWEKSFEDFLKPARTASNRRKYSLEDLDRVKAIKTLLEHEHLTTYGVRLRLQEIFPPEQGKPETRKSRRDRGASPSLASFDPSIQ